MNNFTKEELFELYKGASLLYQREGLCSQRIILEKMQSLIDNYCENKESECTIRKQDFISWGKEND